MINDSYLLEFLAQILISNEKSVYGSNAPTFSDKFLNDWQDECPNLH